MTEETMSEEPKSTYEGALNDFWNGRNSQAAKQQDSGRLDAGLRGAVTGGGHLDGVRDLLAELFLKYGFPEDSIRRKQNIVLPGYYRPTKEWDLLVIHQNRLVAAVELKSQVGPSFGNNFNNRTEEALGNAVDIWRAYEAGTFGDIKPWLGYVFVLEESDKSTKPISIQKSLFPVDGIFTDTSYKDRYSILCDRLVKERLYDAAWFVTSTQEGVSDEPSAGLSFANFEAAIAGRAAYIHALG
jgi:hypothetical protein